MVCRLRYPKAGLKICSHCDGKKNERAAGYVAQGLCSCGRARAPDRMRCPSCVESNDRSQAKRTKRLLLVGRCVHCSTMIYGKTKTCPKCIAKIAAYGSIKRAANVAAGLCACGRDKLRKRDAQCPTCSFKRVFQRIRDRLAVRASR